MTDEQPSDPREPGPALCADGSLDLGQPATIPATEDPAPQPVAEPEAPLELVERPWTPPPVWEPEPAYRPTPTPQPSGSGRWPIGVAVVTAIGAVVVAGLVVWRWAPPQDGVTSTPAFLEWLPAIARATVIIESSPAGATVVANDETLGVTPWAGSLPLAPTTELRLTLKGYQPWTGTLKEAPEHHLSVTLRRAR